MTLGEAMKHSLALAREEKSERYEERVFQVAKDVLCVMLADRPHMSADVASRRAMKYAMKLVEEIEKL